MGSTAEGATRARPLSGIRVLAAEQLQALPFCTQILQDLGADVVKIEPPGTGEMARSSIPGAKDRVGRPMGGTFIRNNINKRSLAIDIKHPDGRDLVLRLASKFDVFAENFRPGALDAFGLGYDRLRAAHPACIYLSISGFGHDSRSPYRNWPALAPIVEAMSGFYSWQIREGIEPRPATAGALGDTIAGLYATIGVLAAVRHRDTTGIGQHIDVAMLDTMLAVRDSAFTDWSLGARGGLTAGLVKAYRASDGWFMLAVLRPHQFAKLADLLGRTEWINDPELSNAAGWIRHADSLIKPVVEDWAKDRTKLEAATAMASAGLPAGPCNDVPDMETDKHIDSSQMLMRLERSDAPSTTILVPGSPLRLAGAIARPEPRLPLLGEDSENVLREELAMEPEEFQRLKAAGVVG